MAKSAHSKASLCQLNWWKQTVCPSSPIGGKSSVGDELILNRRELVQLPLKSLAQLQLYSTRGGLRQQAHKTFIPDLIPAFLTHPKLTLSIVVTLAGLSLSGLFGQIYIAIHCNKHWYSSQWCTVINIHLWKTKDTCWQGKLWWFQANCWSIIASCTIIG